MAELLEKSSKLRNLAWGIVFAIYLFGIASIIHALKQ